MEKKILKTLSIRVKNEKELNIISKFQDVMVFESRSIPDFIIEMMNTYTKKNYPRDIMLISEKEMITRCHREGISCTQGTVKVYRRRHILQDPDGSKWYFNNAEGQLRYNWEKMREFLAERSAKPFSRLKKS